MQRQSARWTAEMWIVAVIAGVLFAVGCRRVGDEDTDSATTEARDGIEASTSVRPGIDVLLADSLHLVQDHRVGLITNHTGLDAEGTSSIDRLFEHPDVDLVALFSPEHGIRGDLQAGAEVDDEVDSATGLPIHSLYGATLRPTPSMLEGIELLLFDLQDVGARYYTYIYTMALAMEAAGEASIPFIVLDRPNPVGGRQVQGNVLEAAFASFVGRYELPMRHGMTPGELAILFRDSFGVGVDLTVVPMDGWARDMLFSDTGLPWRPPSPNMPDLESALHYAGICLFEGTNLSVGRGTERAFQWVGAPWLDGDELARRLAGTGLAGVRFYPARFTPRQPGDGKFDGTEVQGVRLEVTDPEAYDPTVTAVVLLIETKRLSGDRWEWNVEHFDRLAGTQRIRNGVEQGDSATTIVQSWQGQVEGFRELRSASLIYE